MPERTSCPTCGSACEIAQDSEGTTSFMPRADHSGLLYGVVMSQTDSGQGAPRERSYTSWPWRVGPPMPEPRRWTLMPLPPTGLGVADGPLLSDGETVEVVEAAAYDTLAKEEHRSREEIRNLYDCLHAAEQRLERYQDALIECARLSGEDMSDGAPTWPEVDVWAVRCVRELRETCDEEPS